MTRCGKWLVPLVVGVLLAASCSSEESGTPPGGGGTGGDTADAVGVTDDAVTVAFIMPDVEVLAEAGLAEDLGDADGAVQALVDDVNDGGGINGRDLKINTYTYDPTDIPASLVNACAQVAQDDPNFVALSPGFFGDGLACLAGDEGVPVLTSNSLATLIFEQADGNAFLFNNTFEENQRALVAGLDADGTLDGLTLGAVNRDEPGAPEALEAGLVPALEEADLTLAESAVITGGAMGDPASVSAAVQQFKEAGVDGVFLLGNPFVSGNFMAEAERQNYAPTYFGSDQSEVISTILPNFAPAGELARLQGVSWKRQGVKVTGEDPSEADAACVERYEGADLDEPLAEPGTTAYDAFMQLCVMFDVLEQALTAAGDDPTRASFVEAMEGIGEFDLGTGSTGFFGPDDHSAPTAVRPVEFQTGCGCFVPTGDWVPTQ